ncbi:bifunctional hydroxymethylpyrimidine kinase/phosphomethylpyrimidine kinase [Bacteroides sp. 224]|uniref:bifunctional hydroxymethylpyrimidine kinase/phosphomethylpyrimidine kinase n=1 Tax=Bacteroides sp. 224 TaxID=2302936 RepID=UPI0013D2EEC8|nr:bifunctional hydroxymethylpyrimidine kinase/phosphomethylpyrimidine kinase [Bacteroides sp. 224]NDV64445.1 bifunctional hydroxymethylpyrimidine kinase/phosphomethylpyrimidine kinase [Bacteroides sp. 224]
MRYPTALTIAGSDSGGGAGIQADLKTFSALGVFGASVITAITAQNTHEVRAVEALSVNIIRQQLETVLDDLQMDVLKTGMLVTPQIIEIVAQAIDKYQVKRVIVDPVMVATTGANLTKADLANAYQELLYPRVSLLTPNIPEAELLTGIPIKNEKDRAQAGDYFLNQGCKAVLIKGGHWTDNKESVDVLFSQDSAPQSFSSGFIRTLNMHGTGCSLASAIAAYMALGDEMTVAIKNAKEYITEAIKSGSHADFNGGNGPINHFFHPQSLKLKI